VIPDWFIWFAWVLGLLATGLGAVYGAIWIGWWLYHEVDLLDDRKRAAVSLIQAKAEHEKKLLNLEFEKAKTLNDQIIEASKG
jgi:hypothetical protein